MQFTTSSITSTRYLDAEAMDSSPDEETNLLNAINGHLTPEDVEDMLKANYENMQDFLRLRVLHASSDDISGSIAIVDQENEWLHEAFDWEKNFLTLHPIEEFDETSFLLAVDTIAKDALDVLRAKESTSKYTEFLPIIQIALARQKLDEASTLDEYCAATGSWGPFDSLAFAHWLTQSEDDNLRTYVREIYWFTYEVTIEEAAKRFKDPERLRQGWSF
ncbi:MAG: hypothetical protein MMC33_008398 [Icmadophila ericetorum]|nr:hypothetical protein [Icmadophila ericetorum]